MNQNTQMNDLNAANSQSTVSAKKLLASTGIAAAVAGVILVTVVLPSEFAIDVTGVGKALGLQRMGEIKQSLEQDAQKADEAQKPLSQSQPQQPVLTETKPKTVAAVQPIATQAVMVVNPTAAVAKLEVVQAVAKTTEAPVVKVAQNSTEVSNSYVLKPNDSLELKVVMKKGETVSYHWTVKGGKLNFDNHGDKPGVSYFNYSKGRSVTEDSGKIVAEFDGNHGWFWRNRSPGNVTLKLTFSGQYSEVKAPMHN